MSSRQPSSAAGGGIDLTTLIVTALASAAAAFTCSKIWAPGTLASAAFTPVVVAVLKEGLARPAKVVTQVVPVRGVVRSASGPHGTEVHDPADPVLAPEAGAPDLERVAQPGEISYHTTPASARARKWRVAIVTGLLGFVVAALIFTVPQLLAGTKTTYFQSGGGGSAKPAVTTTVPGKTVTQPPPQTVTAAPPATVTVAPPVTTTVTTPPAATTPTPAPSGGSTTVPASPTPVPVSP
jgi:hypothetical protein